MKKFITFLFLTFCVLVLAREVRADYASVYQDYINKTGIYQSAHSSYLTARATFLASGSLDSEDKAKAATLLMLESRDNVLVSYLNAIKEKINITQGLTDTDKNSQISQLNKEISWYNSHISRLPSAGSLQDLVSDSNEAKNEFNNSTLLIVYTNLISIGAANNSFIRGEMNGEISALQSKIAEIKANQDKDVGLIERSLVDVQNKLSRSEEKDSEAKSLISSVKPGNNLSNNFTTAQSSLVNSNLYLKEANQGLLQIITQIKTK